MKQFFSIFIGKLTILFLKITGHNASSLPGKIACKIDSNILRKLSKRIKKETIVICGTNGKTTTNNMIEQVLTKKNNKVVCNKLGSNMYYGIVTAFIEKSSWSGILDADYATLEVDELSTIKVFKEINIDYFVLTNLFRDQLDRYGEIDTVINKIRESLKNINKNNITFILNGDDPLCSSFLENNKNRSIYYGIEKTIKNNIEEARDGRFCPICGTELKYNFYHYSQLGDYFCKKCNFKHPSLDFEAKKILIGNGISFNLKNIKKEYSFFLNSKGFYNIYNILASIVVLNELNIKVEEAELILREYKTQLGRMEYFFIKKPIFLNLSKNPTGFNQAIKIISEEKDTLDIIFILNDNAQDGEDISWIWDSEFKYFKKENILNFYLSGTRANEIALRLKYEDIDLKKILVYKDIKIALEKGISGKGNKTFILITYTALFETRKWLEAKGKKEFFKDR